MFAKVISQSKKINWLPRIGILADPVSHTPAEVKDLIATPLTDFQFKKLTTEYDKFNKQCGQELMDMNQNLIQNIISRGGDSGWEHDDNYDWLKKTFHFTSFEQATAFVKAVGIKAQQIDHHPEWSTSDGGCKIHVKLTSHFADNKVTRLDFQLAEILNEEYAVATKTFKMHQMFNTKEWGSMKIAFGSLVLGVFFLRMYMGHDLFARKTRQSDEMQFQTTDYVLPANLVSETQVEDIVKCNMDVHALKSAMDNKNQRPFYKKF